MTTCIQRKFYRILFLLLAFIIKEYLAAQNTSGDSTRTILSGSSTARLQTDSIKIPEIAPLGIGEQRGLFIAAPDRKMQLCIFGSVRYLVVFDNHDLTTENIKFKNYEHKKKN